MSSRSTAASKRLPVGTSSSSSSSSTSSSINAGGIPLSTSGLPITSHAYSNSPLDDILASNGLTRYHLEPPTWRAPWTRSTTNTSNGAKVVPSSGGTSLQSLATVSYPQFYPTVDGQEEDQLTEQAVKAGFSNKAVVQVSGHQRLHADTMICFDIVSLRPRHSRPINSSTRSSRAPISWATWPGWQVPCKRGNNNYYPHTSELATG